MARKHKKIVEGMSDRQRYNILKPRRLVLESVDENKLNMISDETRIELYQASLKQAKEGKKYAKKIIKKIGEEFGVYKNYENSDIQMQFSFSRTGILESVEKQEARYNDFVKMLTCLDGVVSNAVGIAVEPIRNYGNKPQNDGTMYILASAFQDSQSIYPVKLEVKEQNKGVDRMLYVAVTESKIKKVDFHGVRKVSALTLPAPLPTFDISIRQMFEKINTIDGSFLKYLPNQFLNRNQKKAKRKALKGQREYIESKKEKKTTAEILRIGSGTPVPKQAKAPSTTAPKNQKTQEKISGHGKKPWHWGMD